MPKELCYTPNSYYLPRYSYCTFDNFVVLPRSWILSCKSIDLRSRASPLPKIGLVLESKSCDFKKTVDILEGYVPYLLMHDDASGYNQQSCNDKS